MPLDGSGYPEFSRGADHQALLITSDKIFDHRNHVCLANLWMYAAVAAFSQHLEISIDKVYIASACEVTTGHLDRYKDKIMALGVGRNLIGPCGQETELFSNKEFDRPGFLYGTHCFTYGFPPTVERMIQEQRDFAASCVMTPYQMLVGFVDIAESARRNIVMLSQSTQVVVMPRG